MTRVIIAFLVLLLVAAALAACGNDGGNNSTPTPTEEESATGTPIFDPSPTPTPTVEPTLDPTKEASLRTEAEGYCPQTDLNACVDRYLDYATGNEPTALCTNNEGRWYFEEPRGDVGDNCDETTTIAVIVGGD